MDATGLCGFDDIALPILDALAKTKFDPLAFGSVGLSDAGIVKIYNAAEARLAGLYTEFIIGTHYSVVVAQ